MKERATELAIRLISVMVEYIKSFDILLFFGRRTADVRTVGYVECFVLSKEDVLSAIRDYPEAQVRELSL